jgi:nucleoside-diphosphate-sugar epimerase
MNCAITGSSGVLGSYIIQNNPKVNFLKFKGDITNKKEITSWILKNNFDIFLHLAAIVPTEEVNKNNVYAKKVNYGGTKNIVNALLKKKKIWFFFASSSHIYSYSLKKLSEKIKPNPITYYGKLKYLAEKYIIKKLKKAKIDYCIGRIFSFTNYNQKKTFLIPSLYNKVLNKNKIMNFDNLNHSRDFISISDINRAILFMINKKIKGVYNIASGKRVNIESIVKKVCKKYNKKIIIKKSYPKSTLVADIKKIKKLGWKPIDNIDDILQNYEKKIKYYYQNT